MAERLPLIARTGSLRVADPSFVLAPIYFSASTSVSRSFQTTLPDPYFFSTQSVDVTDNGNEATSQSLFNFSVQTMPEKYYYLTNAILGVRSAQTATGVRVALKSENNADTFLVIKTGALSLTAFTYLFQGTNDAASFVAPATTTATNTTYPLYIQGILNNSTTTGSFSNTIWLQSETAQIVTAVSGSLFYNQYAGYSSSFNQTQSAFPLILTSSRIATIESADTLSQSVLPPTQSLWISQSLAANVTTTSNTVYSNVFTLTGLTTGQRYLVNFYLIGSTVITTTGLQIRAISGSAYRGSIWSPTSATAFSIQNSADGDNITNLATAWPVNNGKYLCYGEYNLVKGATDPIISVKSEINTSGITIFSGSAVFYRAIN